jgi:hypothetical protein
MTNELRTIPTDDGWSDTEADDRIIQGTLLRCVDGHWSDKAGTDLPKQLLALATTTVLQRWENKKPAETIVKRPGEPLPDIDELNTATHEEDWEIGIDGEPRPPWQKQWLLYLLDPNTAAKFTYANGTTGARIAVENLKDQIKWMRAMRSANVVPLVELVNKPMRTKYGQKLRPEFKVISWHELGVCGNVIEGSTPPRQLPQANPYAEAKGRTLKTIDPVANRITEVEPPSAKEELDDEIPF